MNRALVLFRGLLAVVRNTSFDAATGKASTVSEKMKILLPLVHHANARHMASHVGAIHFHPASIDGRSRYTLRDLLGESPFKYFPVGEGQRTAYYSFALDKGVSVALAPGHGEVGHDAEETVSEIAPQACPVADGFRTLSRLPNLNRLTKGQLKPLNSLSLQATVSLEGGRLTGVQSEKPLARAFFDFFDRDGTVAVQQAVEEVVFECPVDEGAIRLQIGNQPLEVQATDGCTIIVDSFPARPLRPKEATLDHFLMYYDLMERKDGKDLAEPFMRVAADCDAPGGAAKPLRVTTRKGLLGDPITQLRFEDPRTPGQFIHIGVNTERDREAAGDLQKMTTEGPCSCLLAQVFEP